MLNFLSLSPVITPRLNTADKRLLVDRLRQVSPVMREALPDVRTAAIEFVEPQPGRMEDALKNKGRVAVVKPIPATIEASNRKELVVRYEKLPPIVYYFPAGTDFSARDQIFKTRPFDATVMRTARSVTLFPGRVPQSVLSRPVVIVGWIEGPHPGGSWLGQVMQCIAIVPVTKEGILDYGHAALVPPRSGGNL